MEGRVGTMAERQASAGHFPVKDITWEPSCIILEQRGRQMRR
jgi:hypothetical protein